METTRATLPLAFALVCLSPFVALPQEPNRPSMSLILNKVTIQTIQGSPPRSLLRCTATLDNTMEHEVTVRSNFTVFDELVLVVTNTAGKVHVRQQYFGHQSPQALQPQKSVLKSGTTSRELTFPVASAELPERSMKVPLVGTLPGSYYKRVLSSDTITVEYRDSRDRLDSARKPTSYAVAGFFDFNDDGKSDSEHLRRLIAAGGGTIDAEFDQDGKVTGKITMTTRYVILARRLANEDSTPESIQKYSDFLGLAKTLKIEFVDVKRLLNGDGGWRAKVRRTSTSGLRPRRPPRRGAPGGAY